MAKTIATIGGIALAPGVSKNNRLYTREAITKAVQRAQGQLGEGKILSVLTHHEAGDSSDRIIGRITSIDLDENGAARFTADLADTPHARTIASLADNTSGRPFLSGMSIRGAWVGQVRRVKGPSGDPVETADDLEFHGIDPTHKPGVDAAGVDTFAWAADGATETTQRVLITESVQEACVTIAEEIAPTEEAAKAQTPAPAGTVYADPGYLADKKKRYPLGPGEKRIRAAWSYINQPDNAKQYTAQQLKRIKGKIRAAMKRIGATVTAEGWVIWPPDAITETAEVDEHYDEMGSGGGTFCVEASNGPICIRISSYCVDPADLDLILRNACEAADVALRSFDPDMDADIDLPGVGPSSDPDGDAGESAEGEGLAEATEDPAPMGVVTTDSKEPVMATATQEAAGQVAEAQIPASAGDPGPTGVDTQTNRLNNNDTSRNSEDDVAGNSFEAFLQSMIELVCSQAVADGKMNPAYTQLAAKLAASQALGMSGPQGAASVALRGAGSVPAPPVSAESAKEEGTVAETEAQMIERIVAERMGTAKPAVEETAEQRISRLVEERIAEEKARLTESGQGPSRKGLVTGPGVTESGPVGDYSEIPEGWPQKPLDQYTATEWKQFVEPHVAQSVFGSRGSAQPA